MGEWQDHIVKDYVGWEIGLQLSLETAYHKPTMYYALEQEGMKVLSVHMVDSEFEPSY